MRLRRGATREDGFVFSGYVRRVGKDGLQYEQWLSPRATETRRFSHIKRSTRYRAQAEGQPYELTTEYLRSIFPADGLCPVFREPLVWGEGSGRDNSPSIDRIVPSAGYVPGNVAFISNRANRLKGGCSLEQLERLVAHVKGNTNAAP